MHSYNPLVIVVLPLRYVLRLASMLVTLATISSLVLPSYTLANETQIDFEGFPCHTIITNEYAHLGVYFVGAKILNSDGDPCLNSSYYPPYSGTGVVSDLAGYEGNLEVHFLHPATSVRVVSARVTGRSNVRMTAYNRTGGVLDTVSTGGSNYVGASLERENNMLLRVVSPETPIRMVVFRDSGNTYTVDDLRFSSEIPVEDDVTPILPALSFPDEGIYAIGSGVPGVDRGRGVAEKDMFTFKVVYTGQQHRSPFVQVLIEDLETAIVSTHVMARDLSATGAHGDGAYENGERFTASVTLPKGAYRYSFRGTDSNATVMLSEVESGSEHRISAGYSNVLFLPGLQASRLYEGNNRLWEPNRNKDVERLYMDENGASVHSGIYTNGVIDEAYGFSVNVYKKFLTFMDKELVGKGVINAWKAVPYDWRIDLEELLRRGMERDGGVYYADRQTDTPYILEKLDALMRSSDSGKVIIVGHSMGGLVARVLINVVREPSHPYHHLFDSIEQLILVASPQLGTPVAIEGLLHGDTQQIGVREWGIFADEERARELSENMPSAYYLLPSREYFKRVASPVIRFHDSIFDQMKTIDELKHRSGTSITSHDELYAFLLGDNGKREEPAPNNEEYPNVLKQHLLDVATAFHTHIDTLPIPAHIGVAQIAGWGQKTVRGIKYSCPILTCGGSINRLNRDLLFTKDGDGTVVVPSAVSSHGDTYYVDLSKYNAWGQFQRNRSHADFLETDPVQELILRRITQVSNDALPTFVSREKPTQTKQDYELILRSPADMEVYDEGGRRTGSILVSPGDGVYGYEAGIPNSYYIRSAGHTYLGFDSEDAREVLIRGTGVGTFTLEVRRTLDDAVYVEEVFADIPVVPSMSARAIFDDRELHTLEVDVDGNGSVDMYIGSEQNHSRASLHVLRVIADTHVKHKGIRSSFLSKIDQSIAAYDEEDWDGARDALKALQQQIMALVDKQVSRDVANTLTLIIDKVIALHVQH